MSFTERNKNFIVIKFYSELKGLSLNEKRIRYRRLLKTETLIRIKNSLTDSNKNLDLLDEIDGPLDLFSSAKRDLGPVVRDYTDILHLLKDLDFENVLLSIFFEQNSSKIFDELSSKILELKPADFEDRFELLSILQNKQSLNDFFIEKLFSRLEVTASEIKFDGPNRNEVTKKLCIWLKRKLCISGSQSEILNVLVYYTLYWHLKFSKINEETKRIILLKNLISCIEEVNYNMKFSFNDIIKDLVDIIFSIYPKVGYPPFIETTDLAIERGSKNYNYSENLNLFKKVLNDSESYLEKFDSMTFNELLIRYSNSDLRLQKVIYEKILERIDTGKVLGNDEIENISKIKLEVKLDSQNLFKHLVQKYYLFGIWDEFSNNLELLNSKYNRIVMEKKRTNIYTINNSNQIVNEPAAAKTKDVLIKISDETLISKLYPILLKSKVLEAVKICMNFYEGKYLEMTFEDWFKLVKELCDNKIDIKLNLDKIEYTDEELQKFKANIEEKLFQAKTHLKKLESEKIDISLIKRQLKFIENLYNALERINNKTYGICKVTGKLISKDRLLAVPHTTLSMEAKIQEYKKKS
jgi:RNA polymerase-binding transcription factor DksA